MRWHETGEAFGVRRPGAAFPALESENESLGSNRTFPKCKAGERGTRPPHSKGFAVTKWLIQFKFNLHTLHFGYGNTVSILRCAATRPMSLTAVMTSV